MLQTRCKRKKKKKNMLCAVSQKKQNTADKRSTPTSHRVAVVTLGCFDFALQNLAIHKKKRKSE